MRLEYRIRYLDRLIYNSCHQFLSPIINGFFLIIPILVFFSELRERSLVVSVLVALAIYLLIWLLQLLFLAILLLTRKSDSVLTEHVLEVHEEGIYDTTKFHESRVFWPGIQRVVSRPGLIAIYVAQHSAMLIPNRAFASREMRNQFLVTLNQRRALANK
jgi:hypothetical protein